MYIEDCELLSDDAHKIYFGRAKMIFYESPKHPVLKAKIGKI